MRRQRKLRFVISRKIPVPGGVSTRKIVGKFKFIRLSLRPDGVTLGVLPRGSAANVLERAEEKAGDQGVVRIGWEY